MLEQEGLNAWGIWEFSDWDLLAAHLKKGFEYAKQRCTAYPRYVVQRSLVPEFLEMYLPVVRSIKFGHPLAVANPDDPLPDLDFGPVINAAKATVAVAEATATFAAQENKRYTDLASTGYGSVQNAQQAQSRIAGAQAAIQRDNANLVSAVKQVDLLNAEIVQAEATLARAQALQNQAELNLSYTTITAPIDAVVGNRTLRTGQFVQAGTQLMSLVPASGAYVVANFKETQLTDVHQGQAVEIAVDMFPGQRVHGHVDSLAPASGQEFALLPPDNATGNFTKIVQRIPVKIALDGADNTVLTLRPGMSVIPTIETRDPAPRRAAAAAASEAPKS